MRGRKPKPTALRVLQHNPGNRPVNDREPQPAPLDPAVPAEVHDDPRATDEWLRGIVPAITAGHITSADRVLAIAHCQLWSAWQSQLALAGDHIIKAGRNKYPIQNPARGMANKTLMMLVRIDVELGFSPISRSRVKAAPKEREQPTRTERLKAEYR